MFYKLRFIFPINVIFSIKLILGSINILFDNYFVINIFSISCKLWPFKANFIIDNCILFSKELIEFDFNIQQYKIIQLRILNRDKF